jgi:hypothetical protein
LTAQALRNTQPSENKHFSAASCAVGCILTPLCGWLPAVFCFLATVRIPDFAHIPVQDLPQKKLLFSRKI